MGKRIAILSLMVVALAVGVVIPAVEAKRLDQQVKRLLLTLQRSVQDYHVAEEVYPKTTPLTGSELIELLLESGHLTEHPLNPWSGKPWSSETEDNDFLVYETDEFAETYTLIAYRGAKHETVHHTLDSTNHQSLEEAP